ncbi:MAG: carbohydrate binding domain-containing protein [Treponema sp.]|nr:carbohydrate binding domain-containing protein [Treponema sp.]
MKTKITIIGVIAVAALMGIAFSACASTGANTGSTASGRASAEAAQNLILNGSFEEGKKGWTCTAWDDIFTLDTTTAYDGTTSLKTVDCFWGANVNQYLAVRPNTNYVVTFYAKVPRNTDQWSCLVKIGVNNISPDKIVDVNPVGDEWKQYELRFNSKDNRRVCLLILGNESEFYVDDFEMHVDK